MRKMILVFMVLFSCVEVFGRPVFVELRSDKELYKVGESAVLSAYIKIQPTNDDFEIIMVSRFNGKSLKIDKISEDEAVSFPPAFEAAGTFEWRVYVYIRDRHQARYYEESVVALKKHNVEINEKLANETDPEIRKMLIELRSRNNRMIYEYRVELNRMRRILEGVRILLKVDPVKTNDRQDVEIISVELDQDDKTYSIDERMNFLIHQLTDFTGSNGPFEYVVRARLRGRKLGVSNTEEYLYQGKTWVFQQDDVGEHQFKALIYMRPENRAKKMRNGIEKAEQRREEYIVARRENEHDSMKYAYYDFKVKRMTKVISNYYLYLERMLELIDNEVVGITVEQ